VYGTGGAGKTTLVLDLVVHLATGTPWLDLLTPPRPIRVALIENEGPRPLYRLKLARKLSAWPEAAEHIFVVEEPWQSVTLQDESHREQLSEAITEHEIDMLAAGPVSRLGMVGGGTLDEIGAFMDLVAAVQRGCDLPPTVLLIHHENRQGQVSGAWEGVPDTLLHVHGAGGGRTRVHWQKIRHATALHGATTHLRWADHEGFEVAEREEVTEDTRREQLLAAVAENGGISWTRLRDRHDDQGRKLVRGRADDLQTTRDELLAEGLLVNVAPRDGQFALWCSDDPAMPRSTVGTASERLPFPSPEEGVVPAPVPRSLRKKERVSGTERPGSFHDEETASYG
jgi:hypothetical protein